MAYTPELSYEDSCTLRRIAWALGGTALDSTKVCAACRDKTKCDVCVFNRNGNNPSET